MLLGHGDAHIERWLSLTVCGCRRERQREIQVLTLEVLLGALNWFSESAQRVFAVSGISEYGGRKINFGWKCSYIPDHLFR